MAASENPAAAADVYLADEILVDLHARLSRIEGQIGGIKRMLADQRDCDDILTQISSIRAATTRVAVLLLQGHLRSCVSDAIRSGDHDAAVERFSTSLSQVLRST